MTPETSDLLISAYLENRLAAVHIDLSYNFSLSYNFNGVLAETGKLAERLRAHAVPNIWVAYPQFVYAGYPRTDTVSLYNQYHPRNEIVGEVGASHNETLILKNTKCAFEDATDGLHDYLRSRNLDTVIVTGVDALCCVEETLKKGLLHLEYNFIVAADCVNIPEGLAYDDYILGRMVQHNSSTATWHMKDRLHITSAERVKDTLSYYTQDCNSPAFAL